MKLNEIGEFGLIGRIAGKVNLHGGVVLGIGDDAAATRPTPGTVTLTTSDMLVEGIHFDQQFSDFHTLGRKTLAVNLSDIAAMGGVPRSFLLSLAIPASMHVELLDDFIAGLLELAEQHGVALIGGDTCASRSGLVISITLMGEQLPELVIPRSGARPGDLVCVTGAVGEAALGLELLRRGRREGRAIMRQLDPVPRVREGQLLAGKRLAGAMVDVSDGLLADLGHILEASGTGARVEIAKLPLDADFCEECRAIGVDPVELALSGGEDYELLFTVPPHLRQEVAELFISLGVRFSIIGEITGGEELTVIAADGSDYPACRKGYNHFAG